MQSSLTKVALHKRPEFADCKGLVKSMQILSIVKLGEKGCPI